MEGTNSTNARWIITVEPSGLGIKKVIPGGAAFTICDVPSEAAVHIAGLAAENERLRDALTACEMIVDVRTCMMMQGVHADFIMHEILAKHGVPNVQLLAKKAQELAASVIANRTPSSRSEPAT